MKDNNQRNRSNDSNQDMNQNVKHGNDRNQQRQGSESNPQQGDEWNNYRSRELGGTSDQSSGMDRGSSNDRSSNK